MKWYDTVLARIIFLIAFAAIVVIGLANGANSCADPADCGPSDISPAPHH